MYTPEELRLLPTIDSGQFSNLKIETPDYRVLLSRLTRADDYLGPPVEYVCRVGGAGDWAKCDSNGLPIPEPIEIVEIVGRRWFCGGPGKPGRTLCSAEIAVNGQPVARVLSNAGYGSMYEQAASRWLWLNGYIEPNEPLHQIAVDYPFRLVSSVVDVPRKMDL